MASPNADRSPIVEIANVSKQFDGGDLALSTVSLQIERGSFVVLLGPSGAGKSTLLRMINALETPTSGHITVDGQSVDSRHLHRSVGMIFQQFNLVGRLSVLTNVLVGRLAHLHGLPLLMSYFYLFGNSDIQIAARALDRVGLTAKAWDRADKLSGGQQQRVGIARALTQQPRLILADEPVASLDPQTAYEVLSLLRTIIREDGLTAIVTLHQVDLARQFADRIVALRKGKLVFDGTPETLTDGVLESIYQHPLVDGDAMPSRANPALEFVPAA